MLHIALCTACQDLNGMSHVARLTSSREKSHAIWRNVYLTIQPVYVLDVSASKTYAAFAASSLFKCLAERGLSLQRKKQEGGNCKQRQQSKGRFGG